MDFYPVQPSNVIGKHKRLKLRDEITGVNVHAYIEVPLEFSKTVNIAEVGVAGIDPIPTEYLNATNWTGSFKIFVDCSMQNMNLRIGTRYFEDALEKMASNPCTLYFPDRKKMRCWITNIKKSYERFDTSDGKPSSLRYEVSLISRGQGLQTV